MTNDGPPFEREQALVTRAEGGWRRVLKRGRVRLVDAAGIITKAEQLGG